MFTSVL